MSPAPAPFTCARCGGCCGPAPCSAAELDLVVQWAAAHDVVARRQGLDCPFLARAAAGLPAGCRVYAVRPSVCRWMGHLEGLECPRAGHGGLLTSRAARRARRQLQRLRRPTTLHSLVYTELELVVLLRGGTTEPSLDRAETGLTIRPGG